MFGFRVVGLGFRGIPVLAIYGLRVVGFREMILLAREAVSIPKPKTKLGIVSGHRGS